ncbi:MAG TPA: hypothetical protein DDY54_01400, partial [Deltaproteobacteria bacterium]|nr:hypothetical protein [Deltaproteobacteria bacterium]
MLKVAPNTKEADMQQKPLGRKNYGPIPHLPGSRMGPGDHKCHEGQARIATAKARDKNDEIFVQEKLDGSNVGVARIGDVLHVLGGSGYASPRPHTSSIVTSAIGRMPTLSTSWQCCGT